MARGRQRQGQMPRAKHAYIGRYLADLDEFLVHLHDELATVYGVRSPGAAGVYTMRRLLTRLRLHLEGCAMREYGDESAMWRAYFPSREKGPGGLERYSPAPWEPPPAG